MVVKVVFEPNPQRLLCGCGITLEYTAEDLVGHPREYISMVKCPVCGYKNEVKSTVTEGKK